MNGVMTRRQAEAERKNGKHFDALLRMVEQGKSQKEAYNLIDHPASTLRGWITDDPERVMLLEHAKQMGRLARLEPLQTMAEDRAMEVLKMMDPGAPTPGQLALITALLKTKYAELRDGPQVAVGVKVESKKPEEEVITLQAAEKEVRANGAAE